MQLINSTIDRAMQATKNAGKRSQSAIGKVSASTAEFRKEGSIQQRCGGRPKSPTNVPDEARFLS